MSVCSLLERNGHMDLLPLLRHTAGLVPVYTRACTSVLVRIYSF